MDCDRRCERALELADQLLRLAENRDVDCDHDECLLLESTLRESAFRIRASAWKQEEPRRPAGGRPLAAATGTRGNPDSKGGT